MYSVYVLNVGIGSEEQIKALSLIDVLLAVGSMLYKPSLIDFHGSLKYVSLPVVEYVGKVLNTAIVGDDT